MDLALGHEVRELQPIHEALERGHLLAGRRDRRNQRGGDRPGACTSDTPEGIPGLVEDEHGANERNAFDAAAFEGQIGDKLRCLATAVRPAIRGKE